MLFSDILFSGNYRDKLIADGKSLKERVEMLEAR
jgi:hypothetical protein